MSYCAGIDRYWYVSPSSYFLKLAEPLDDDDLERKEEYIKQCFPDWSRRDFQQLLVRGLETYGWYGIIRLMTQPDHIRDGSNRWL